ncbi:hypothetical protein Cgig2_030302 [Carnegiea gigantea]|uniref:Uncharacterized protein n=1 Tax=Carnegiea gigantea TaxID=171969 RepID=A0A9Q1Q5A9_9CARY|nr:hypothetical protein Cgig2_030302 [Carnegiea gigantea]
MASGLKEVWSRLSLTEEEEQVVVCDDDKGDESSVKEHLEAGLRSNNTEASKAQMQLKFEDVGSKKQNMGLSDHGREDVIVDDTRAVRVGNEVFKPKKQDMMKGWGPSSSMAERCPGGGRHPDAGICELNFNAAKLGDGGYGWGVVARDSEGDVVFSVVQQRTGFLGPEMEEAQAYTFTIQMAR